MAAPGRAVAAPRGPGALLVGALIVVLVVAGVGLVWFASHGRVVPGMVPPTPTITPTLPPPPTFTATATATETLEPTATPLQPTPYVVKTGDQCGIIAANFDVSVQSIIALNHLDPNCLLPVGKTIMIPQPTSTPTPFPTATLPGGLATEPPPFTHTVVSGETCGGIAKTYKINLSDLISNNGLKADCTIRPGQILIIPFPAPVGPTPTPTVPPPYPAPKLLLPADGQQFVTAEDTTVTLQWASVGELQANEAYYVVVEDVTCRCARFYKQYVTETKLIVPEDYRPTETAPHLFRWNVSTVRQENPGAAGQPIYDPAGATSADSDFIWAGGGAGAAATSSP